MRKQKIIFMKIIKAKPEDYPKTRLFYHSVIDVIQGQKYLPGWRKDIYPDPDDIKQEIAEGCLYYGLVDGEMAAAMVVNQKCHEEYQNAKWKIDAAPDEFMVIHILAVHPRFGRQGLAKELVRFALDLARNAGMKAMRLDVLKGNLPAEKLYPGLGFEYIETRPMFYEDVGVMEFELFEYGL